MPSPTRQKSQTEWLMRKRRNRLSRFEITWQRIMLYHRQKCLVVLGLLVLTVVYRTNNNQNTSWSLTTTKSNLRAPSKISFPPSEQDLKKLNAELKDPDQILKWAANQFSDHSLVQFTSFGPSGLVILDKLYRMGLLENIPAVTIDTLHLFPETYDLVTKVRETYSKSLKLHNYTPNGFGTRQKFDDQFGAGLWKADPDTYSQLTKLEPTRRALKDLNVSAWITGRRRSQGGERTDLQVLELDDDGRLKINPLAGWSYDDVWNYLLEFQVPYNALHDAGYKSVGDVMTSRAVPPTAPERSGRFVGMNTTECGMHSHLEKIKRLREEAEAQDEVFVLPTLPCDDCNDVDLTNFEAQIIQSTQADILLEFYSPLCGACQEFSPTFKGIAKKLKAAPQITVARFDVTESEMTDTMREQGFVVEVTPTLYLVQHDPLRVSLYEGEPNEFDILDWLGKKTPTLNLKM
jgi:phosphoadenosine phosphosulfate reductase